MPEEEAKLVRRAFTEMYRGEYQEAVRAFHDDAVWHNTREFPGPRCCQGPQAIIDFCTSMMEDFEGTQEVERLAQAGTTVAIGMRSVGRARRSRIPADVRWAAVVKVSDGRISRVDVHGEWSKALKAAGLKD